MSEGNHSPETAPVSITTNPRPRNRWTTILGGTAVMAFGAGVLFQVLRPEPAASQTRRSPLRVALLLQRAAAASSDVLARVKNQTIGYDAVARECVERHGKDVLENMINRTLIQQECDRQGVTISKADVEQEIAAITKKFNLPVDQWLRHAGPGAWCDSAAVSERRDLADAGTAKAGWPAGRNQGQRSRHAAGLRTRLRPARQSPLYRAAGNVRQSDSVLKKCKAEPDKFEDLAAEFSTDPNTRTLVERCRRFASTAELRRLKKWRSR